MLFEVIGLPSSLSGLKPIRNDAFKMDIKLTDEKLHTAELQLILHTLISLKVLIMEIKRCHWVIGKINAQLSQFSIRGTLFQ